MADNSTPPPEFICPITMQLMMNPFSDDNGHTYEYDAIREWLDKHPFSPITRKPLTVNALSPNRALKDLIDRYRQQMGTVAHTDMFASIKAHAPAVQARRPQPAPIVVTPEGSLQGQPAAAITRNGGQVVPVHLSVQAPTTNTRVQTDVVAVIDTSGSMGAAARRESRDGLSIIDIVKQGVRVISNTLGENDRLMIVAYSSHATVLLDFTTMDTNGQQLVDTKLNEMHASGQTNIWDAVHVALESVRLRTDTSRNASIVVLTDGMPNISPPDGEIETLKQYQDTYGTEASISTFCFGYNLESELMSTLAQTGGGFFAFIPDATFVLTVFVHYISNILSLAASQTTIDIRGINGAQLSSTNDQLHHFTKTSWGASVSLGWMQQGQPRDVVIDVVLPDDYSAGREEYIDAKVSYTSVHDNNKYTMRTAVGGTETNEAALYHLARKRYLTTVSEALASMRKFEDHEIAKTLLVSLVETMKRSSLYTKNQPYAALVTELTGQVMEALTNMDYYTRWGRHYIPSLLCAHTHQMCNNFKDHGVQFYGGRLFKEIRDATDQKCLELPPPTPSSGCATRGGIPSTQPTITRTQMQQTYNNPSGGCIAGECLVECFNDEHTPMKMLTAGDMVRTHDGYDKVQAIVQFVSSDGFQMSCFKKNGLILTPHHPVLVPAAGRMQWQHPSNLVGEYADAERDCVYAVLLENRSSTVLVCGVPCITLAHGVENDDVATHSYLGTESIVSDLAHHPTFHTGRMVLSVNAFERDTHGWITGLHLSNGTQSVQCSL